ncbi:large subunit ribosomal protein L18 [Marchantia polymorpha subsp. ruderalis]|uniref:Uncharacterized protein n=2 Tax=Marchantia polymorpha TaxID=3197 RepID=A0A176WKG7_MARPO|nr:hypothetical protein AXG93_862s1030 [Marchantia polymorpha subsp. ruderalis]PTQ33863.1 hypothetical protein MARPO_0085s0073 [Marchantia polymorpha]BBN05013.1 hypothetical protein Mp_3g09540 [Marchantia polymorpha subsp. ruderalis]|eukprot:PTQ33863.1 hypothetical protein MARPO_0085s0073 [Marchantia polymorpha]
MLKFVADRALAAARFHLLHSSPAKLSIGPLGEAARQSGGVLSFSTRSRHRRQPDSDEDLDWDEDVDRELPWPERKSRQEAAAAKKKKHRRSFKLRCEKFLKPFTLDIFISNRFIHATIMHRALHKVVAVANSNAKEFRGSLPSYGDMRAAWVIGKVLSDRAKEADVYTVIYEPRRGEKMDNRMQTIIDTLVENGIALELDKTG